ncbi:MAG: hypothetical protein KAS47_05715 [Candidatus Heimdallarchaeota archaeon]|nr:hypothetical protein [Candidatus Heimdallarchaeota archaeon]
MESVQPQDIKDWTYYDIVTFILYQQFFKKPHFIIDRRAEKRIKVKGSREVLNQLTLKIRDISYLFDEGKEEEFIKQLASKFNIRVKDIYDQYTEKISNLEEIQKKDRNFMMMIALSVIVSYFQKRSTESTHKMLKEVVNSTIDSKLFTKTLELLDQKADVDLYLLQNLTTLMKYAKLTKIEIAEKHIEKRKKKVIEKILLESETI